MSSVNPPPNPYVGPRAFQTGERLYGRDRELSQLIDLLVAERIILLHSPSGAGKSSLIQAGLIPKLEEEGFQVLPLIRINLDPPAGLREEYSINRYIYSTLVSLQEGLGEGQRASADALAKMTLEDCLERCSFSPDGKNEDESSSKVLVFDQFEEVLTVDPTRRREKTAFFTQLGTILRDRSYWALFSMREDYLAALDPYLRPVPTRLRNTFRLDFLGKDAAFQAIQWPARQAGVDFTDAAVAKLVDDLRRVQVQRPDGIMEEQLGPYVEPVQLQVVCYRLWEHLPQDATQILTQDIESVGDVDAALSDYYAERVAAVATQTGTSERLIRDWFEHRLITPGGIRGQVLMARERSEGLDNQAIRLLENAHLLRAEKRGGAIWFELAHDRLIGPVRTNNSAWFQSHLSLFQRQATLWESEKRPDSLLLRDRDLDEAEQWAEVHAQELTETERNYLENCLELRKREEETRKLAEAQQVAEAERQRAELQARSARQLRRLARIIAAALVLAVITTILAGFFWQRSQLQADFNASLAATKENLAAVNQVYASTNQAIAITAQSASTQAIAQQKTAEAASIQENLQRQTAEAASLLANEQKATAEYNAGLANEQASIAFSRQLASQSLSYLNSQEDLAMLLGVEAYHTAGTVEAKSALLTGLQRGLSQTVNPFGRPIPPENTAVVSAAISPVGDRLAYGNAEGKVVIWDYVHGEIVDVSNDHQGIVFGVAFSPDGKTLASAGEDSSIVLWDLDSGKKTRIPNINKVLSVSWSPQGDKLAAAVGPHVVIWEPSNLKAPVVDQNLLIDVNSVAWSPDGKMIAAGTSFPNLTILDPSTGLINQRLSAHQGKIRSVAWSADSKYLATGAADNLVYIWDTATWSPVGEPLKGHSDEVLSVSISHDNSILASGSKDGTIILWDMKTHRKYGLPLTNHTSDVNSLTFIATDGPTLLLSASRDKSVQLVQLITQQPLQKSLPSIAGQVLSLGIEPGGSLLALGQMDNQPSIWNVQGNQQGPALSISEAPSSAAISKDGSTLAIGTDAGKISLFNASSGNLLHTIDTAGGKVLSLAFSSDGQMLASSHCGETAQSGDLVTCSKNEIYLWDAATGEPAAQPIEGHEDFILAISFSPDGKLLASGSQDKKIRLWEVDTGKQVGLPLDRHIDGVTSLAFSPDGNILASGSADNTLLLWDVATSQPIGEPLLGSPGSASSLAFSPDSKFLYSGYGDGTILVWDIDFDAWVQRACGLAERNLTPEEWGQFFRFQSQTYHPTCEQFPLETQAAPAATMTATP